MPNIIKDCYSGEHKLCVILAVSNVDSTDTVVRWCEICGAVVVDIDHDGRTNAGQILNMTFPQITQEILNAC